ncbi:MAG: ShlB/FhaC/HecB family hemolysin secretion/activation protein [Flavobacteriaceae bacterium]|nr:ShlB/FhaC/HecB family hemolysin secretion/activation protein [Flavobacteriaceae bacterium]
MKALFTPYIYTLFFGLIFISIHAQNWQLKITPTDSISVEKFKSVTYQPILSSEKEIQAEIEKILTQLEQKGIFNPKLELIETSNQMYHYSLSIEKVLEKITLYFDENLLIPWLNSLDDKHSITIPIEQTASFLKTTIAHFEENGYSFVEIKIINQKIENNQLSAFVQINYTKKRTIDKIIIEGYSEFPLSFLKHSTPLKIGTAFNQQKISKASKAIQRLSFVNQLKESAVLFTNDSTIVYLYLNKKKAHQFDGLIGFNNTEDNSKLKLHGYVDVQLNNLFNKGEQLSMHWQNTSQKQTSFQLNTSIPYIFNLPFTIEGSFDLHKQDSTFLTTSFNAGLLYRINQHTIKTSIETYTSDLLTTSNDVLISDYKKTYYGLSYSYRLEKEQFFPTQFESSFGAYTGNRKTTLENSTQQKVVFLINYTWEINPRNYLFLQNQSAKLIGKYFLTNELILIGGTNTIRGFNENQLFSSAYSIFNLEYRLVTSADSYFYSITDFGKSKNKIDEINLDMLGIGLGYVFKVNSGFLNISYSIGKFSNASFDFNQSKVHLKWVQNF